MVFIGFFSFIYFLELFKTGFLTAFYLPVYWFVYTYKRQTLHSEKEPGKSL